jgi:transcriptional regulator with XRE-family HTH domain
LTDIDIQYIILVAPECLIHYKLFWKKTKQKGKKKMRSKESLEYIVKTQLYCIGKTQKWLAQETGVTSGHISFILTSRCRPSLLLLKKIATAIEMDAGELLKHVV